MSRSEDPATLAKRLVGGVWGHLVGDAVGVPCEFREPDGIGEIRFGARGTHRQPPGTWSDDGALVLALLYVYVVARLLAGERDRLLIARGVA